MIAYSIYIHENPTMYIEICILLPLQRVAASEAAKGAERLKRADAYGIMHASGGGVGAYGGPLASGHVDLSLVLSSPLAARAYTDMLEAACVAVVQVLVFTGSSILWCMMSVNMPAWGLEAYSCWMTRLKGFTFVQIHIRIPMHVCIPAVLVRQAH